jgi:acyl-CoA synthetase (AMP-forming)/AMP-acid ligase II
MDTAADCNAFRLIECRVTTEPSPTIPETKADGPSFAVDPRAAIDAIPRAYNFADDILERNLKAGRANKPVYVDPRGAWTYGQLAERVGRFGCVLRSLGIRREERVLLALLDTIDWPTAFLGAIKAGIVPIPVNTLMTEDDYRFVLTDSRAKALVVSEALYPKFANLIGAAPELMHVIVSGENAGAIAGSKMCSQTRVRNPIPRRRRGTIFASGSTPQARLEGPRPRCMSMPVCDSPPTSTRAGSWA